MSTDPLAGLLAAPGVSEAVESARQAVDVALSNRVLRRGGGSRVAGESSVRGAMAAAWLSGATISLDDVRSGAATALEDPLVQGALRAYGALGELAPSWGTAPRQAFARLDVLAAADLVESERLGTPRGARFVASRLDTLADTLQATSAPAVLVAAIVHAEVLSLDAFAPVSGIVARAAARLALADRGLDPSSVIVVEVGQRDHEDVHASALAAYASGTPDGVVEWVLQYATFVEQGATETLAICQAVQRG
ncbi:oxidoreductase [Jatrophihabitans sp. YIM 134969]